MFRTLSKGRQKTTLLVLLLTTVSLPVCAVSLHKWADENGNVHYSDKPPPGQQTETIQVDTGRVDDSNTKRLDGYQEQVDEIFTKRGKEKAEADKKAKKMAKIKAHCEDSRAKLVRLQTSSRRQKINEKGEQVFIEESQRQEWIKTAEAEIAKHCP